MKLIVNICAGIIVFTSVPTIGFDNNQVPESYPDGIHELTIGNGTTYKHKFMTGIPSFNNGEWGEITGGGLLVKSYPPNENIYYALWYVTFKLKNQQVSEIQITDISDKTEVQVIAEKNPGIIASNEMIVLSDKKRFIVDTENMPWLYTDKDSIRHFKITIKYSDNEIRIMQPVLYTKAQKNAYIKQIQGTEIK